MKNRLIPSRSPNGFLIGLTIGLMAFSPTKSSVRADSPARHYSGVVLDADTHAPVPDATIVAYHSSAFTIISTPTPVLLSEVTSGKDGSFNLELAPGQPSVSYLSVSDAGHKGQRGSHQGVFYHLSARRSNLLSVHKET